MLIRFEVENFRSLRNPAELSMVAIDTDRPGAHPQEALGISLVSTAGIYGPNASGKSNLLAAIAWLRDAVATSMRAWDERIPVEPFSSPGDVQRDSSFTLEMMVEGVRFEYLLDLDEHRVSYEALHHYPEGRRRRVFEREGNDLVIQRGLGILSGARQLITDRVLALSVMRRFDEPITTSFADAVLRVSVLGRPLLWAPRRPLPDRTLSPLDLPSSLQVFDLEDTDPDLFEAGGEESPIPVGSALRRRALALLHLADLGIDDVTVVDRTEMQLIHSIDGRPHPMPPEAESAGTRTWLNLVGPLLAAIQNQHVVLFDEIEANLHPTLTLQILKLFTAQPDRASAAQLLFTSHDTNLLNELNRDEIWLTQKDDRGATTAGPLSDFAGARVRRSVDLERGYLSGRFGALPDVSQPQALRELGLIG